jgi:hypothetical protein
VSRVLAALLLVCSFAAGALEDPMRPPMAAATARKAGPVEPEFSLTSTWISRDRRSAVVNGKTVSVGDRVDDAEVLEILPTQVRLQQRDHELVVRLLPVSVKTPAKTEEREQQ